VAPSIFHDNSKNVLFCYGPEKGFENDFINLSLMVLMLKQFFSPLKIYDLDTMLENFLRLLFTNVRNKLECLPPDRPFQLSLNQNLHD
jgi:hypothetical protein